MEGKKDGRSSKPGHHSLQSRRPGTRRDKKRPLRYIATTLHGDVHNKRIERNGISSILLGKYSVIQHHVLNTRRNGCIEHDCQHISTPLSDSASKGNFIIHTTSTQAMEVVDYEFIRSGKSKQASLQAFFQTTLSLCVHTEAFWESEFGVWDALLGVRISLSLSSSSVRVDAGVLYYRVCMCVLEEWEMLLVVQFPR